MAITLTIPAEAGQHVNQLKGFNENNVYHVNDYDSVNAFNGNLTISIPIGPAYPAAEGSSIQLMLHSNANVWDVEEYKGGCALATMALLHRRANAGLGWILTLGRLFDPLHPTAGNQWTYESPDGADHVFGPSTSQVSTAAVTYTADGSFLRMTEVNAASRKIEFPDGTIHYFKPTAADTTIWLLDRVKRRYGSQANDEIELYRIEVSDDKWTIVENGRSHVIQFVRVKNLTCPGCTGAGYDGNKEHQMVQSVTFASGARYAFDYDSATLGRQKDIHTVHPSCMSMATTAWLLSSITQPDGSTFAFTYNQSLSGIGPVGLPLSMTLPTGGRISWEWGRYDKPAYSAAAGEVYFQFSWGIWKRFLHPRGGESSQLWLYDRDSDDDDDPNWDDPNWLVRYYMMKLTDPAGKVTESYFDVEPHPTSGGPSRNYGRPYTGVFVEQGSGRRLSQKISARDAPTTAVPNPPLVLRQTTYVDYEDDFPANAEGPVLGGRVKSQQVVQNDDENRSLTTFNDGYDGLGHYRRVTLSGSAIGIARTIETNFQRSDDAASGDAVQIPIGKPWITGLHDWVEKRETVGTTTTTERVRICMDEWTGRVAGRRVERHADWKRDLYSFFTYDMKGNTIAEAFYGGDAKPLANAQSAPLCTAPTGAASYRLVHETDAGVRKSTKYDGVSFKSADMDIDARTALPTESRDASKVSTKYDYDNMGRLTLVQPTGSASTEYTYKAETAEAPAEVVVAQRKDGVPTELTLARYFYDGFGRVVQRSRKMSASGWAKTWTEYDVLGRKVREIMPVTRPDGDYEALPTSAPRTLWTYDGQGRPRTIKQPDGTDVLLAYQGNRLTRRTMTLATGTADPVTTNLEEVDGFGRLVRVVEDEQGLGYVTRYGYDIGDRLSTVTLDEAPSPARRFTYDQAGLLITETHPETVSTSYEYDARGNMTKRTLATVPTPTVMNHEYDEAERLKTVKAGTVLVKEFLYDRSVTGIDLGKLYRAIRYNRHPAFPGNVQTVEENYNFDATTGAIAEKTTTVGSKSFVDTYTYDGLGAIEEIGYPHCANNTVCLGVANEKRLVTTTRAFGLTTAVGAYAYDIQHHASGMLKQIQHRNSDGQNGPLYSQIQNDSDGLPRPLRIEVSRFCVGLYPKAPAPVMQTVDAQQQFTFTLEMPSGATSSQWYERTASGAEIELSGETGLTLTRTADITRTYFARVRNDVCWADTPSCTVQVNGSCAAPAVTIQLADSVVANVPLTAAVAPTSGASYVWEVIGNGVLHTNNASSISFTPGCTGTVKVKVTVTTSCGSDTGETPTMPVLAPTATVAGSTTVPTAQTPAQLQVTLSGLGPWHLTWNDGHTETLHSGQAPQPVTLPPGQTSYTYSLISVTDSLGCSATVGGSATVTVLTQSCAAVVSGTQTVTQGNTVKIQVNLTGQAPWTVKWNDSEVTYEVNGSLQKREFVAVGTAVYTVVSAIDSRGCSATISGAAFITVKPPAPTVVAAKAIAPTAPQTQVKVQVTWSYNGQLDTFLVFRNRQLIATLNNPSLRSYVDSTVVADSAYIYSLAAVKNDTQSSSSGTDLATTVIFENDPLRPEHEIRKQHILQLRTAIAAVRTLAQLAPTAFTDTLSTTTEVKAVHFNELRTALDAARIKLGLSSTAYDRPLLQVPPPILILRQDLNALRGGVQ
jgi:YD repeat-containing protein